MLSSACRVWLTPTFSLIDSFNQSRPRLIALIVLSLDIVSYIRTEITQITHSAQLASTWPSLLPPTAAHRRRRHPIRYRRSPASLDNSASCRRLRPQRWTASSTSSSWQPPSAVRPVEAQSRTPRGRRPSRCAVAVKTTPMSRHYASTASADVVLRAVSTLFEDGVDGSRRTVRTRWARRRRGRRRAAADHLWRYSELWPACRRRGEVGTWMDRQTDCRCGPMRSCLESRAEQFMRL